MKGENNDKRDTRGAGNERWAGLRLMVLNHSVPALRPVSDPSFVSGVFMLTFCLIMAYLGLAALGSHRAIGGVLLILAFSYLCLGIDALIGTRNWIMFIGGYAGLISAVLAFYVSAATAINSAFRRRMLPLA